MAWNSLRCSRHFSRSCLAQNTMSAVPLPGRKPAWDSGRTRSARQGSGDLPESRQLRHPVLHGELGDRIEEAVCCACRTVQELHEMLLPSLDLVSWRSANLCIWWAKLTHH
ncbi:uncharacterized protein LOC127602295 isoform X4 [Hippocampus zosterae]|uniref:uncharacterized protein LOC127602295 isoform X4 n=1 Tax=Hippocampus zosterae TaxID=109293 RepID=UPI00223D1A08|nr:uncharacterized protein LOC127602295 isoform X4 [Hippocampus zosterae]